MTKSGDKSHWCSLGLSTLTLHMVVVYSACVALGKVRTRDEIFIKDWKFNGLLNVKHSIKNRLAKESEDARNTIHDQIDGLEEQKVDESQIVVDVLDQRGEIELIES
ncbi:hypothetical protein EDD21DRAFT_408784 [Dissophora ornata]|nr:hypothetical protein EDD21DRAFT_408784 [Dissophora ornata]